MTKNDEKNMKKKARDNITNFLKNFFHLLSFLSFLFVFIFAIFPLLWNWSLAQKHLNLKVWFLIFELLVREKFKNQISNIKYSKIQMFLGPPLEPKTLHKKKKHANKNDKNEKLKWHSALILFQELCLITPWQGLCVSTARQPWCHRWDSVQRRLCTARRVISIHGKIRMGKPRGNKNKLWRLTNHHEQLKTWTTKTWRCGGTNRSTDAMRHHMEWNSRRFNRRRTPPKPQCANSPNFSAGSDVKNLWPTLRMSLSSRSAKTLTNTLTAGSDVKRLHTSLSTSLTSNSCRIVEDHDSV